MFNVKDPIPESLKSFVVYKFVCPCRNACYIGEGARHLLTTTKEHLETDKKSHIFTPFRLKLKEAMHIIW